MSAADDLAVLARVTVSLVVVIALAVLAARFARRAGVRGGGTGLRVVERTGLSREASIAVVEVAGRGLVLGITAHGVSLLTELEAGQLEASRPPVDEEPRAPRQPLTLSSLLGEERPAGTGSVLDPRTWRQAVEALRDATARRR